MQHLSSEFYNCMLAAISYRRIRCRIFFSQQMPQGCIFFQLLQVVESLINCRSTVLFLCTFAATNCRPSCHIFLAITVTVRIAAACCRNRPSHLTHIKIFNSACGFVPAKQLLRNYATVNDRRQRPASSRCKTCSEMATAAKNMRQPTRRRLPADGGCRHTV